MLLLSAVGTHVLASVPPDVVITESSSYGGYGTIAGKLTSKPSSSVGVSVENGNIRYSTVTDEEGKWAIVIRHRSSKVQAYSWDLNIPADRSTEQALSLPAAVTNIEFASQLPWFERAEASASSLNESSARWDAEYSVRSKVSRIERRCISVSPQ